MEAEFRDIYYLMFSVIFYISCMAKEYKNYPVAFFDPVGDRVLLFPDNLSEALIKVNGVWKKGSFSAEDISNNFNKVEDDNKAVFYLEEAEKQMNC